MRANVLVAACVALLGWSAGAPAQVAPPQRSLAAMQDLTRELAESYLELWSSSNQAALADVQHVYGPKVVFYGETMGRRELTDVKRRFVERWPVRRYAHRPGTLHILCEEAVRLCTARSIIDWEARSPSRNAAASGSSEFELGIDFNGDEPLVVIENGRTLSRKGDMAQGPALR